jgi:hypothetical protein
VRGGLLETLRVRAEVWSQQENIRRHSHGYGF